VSVVDFAHKNYPSYTILFCSLHSVAEQWGADFVCLGARGHNQSIDRASLPTGSVASYVSQHAPCSVIVVKK
jgi:nucleotide-binding universal stress UspA family protein